MKSRAINITPAHFYARITVDEQTGCHEFAKSSKGTGGYSSISYNGKVWRAHRLAYVFKYGPIPDGLYVCHKCDNRKCCNPDHLFLGTHEDNTIDMLKKERHYNMKLTTEQVISIREELKKGNRLGADLARKYGVTISCICDIKRGKSWKHLLSDESKSTIYA